MTIVHVASIPHTASRFVVEQIFRDFEHVNHHDPIRPMSIYDAHIGTPYSEAVAGGAMKAGAVVVIPMRHPDAVTTSWVRRGADLDRLAALWVELRNHESALFIPVDHPDRDTYLAAVSESIGYKLTTDWQPYNAEFDGGKETNASAEAGWVVDLLYREVGACQ